MKIYLRMDSAAARAQLRRWGNEFRDKTKKAVAQALKQEATQIREAVRRHVGSQLRVVKKGFLKGFTAKVMDKDQTRLPALFVGSRIPWAGMHERGGRIEKKMLIPLHGRVGRKRFKAQVDELMRGGNAFFVKNARGNIVLMAENIKEHDRPLAGFKRRYRKAEGIKRLKRGHSVPIAVLVPRVALKKRLDVKRLVVARVPELVAEVEKRLRMLG